MTDTKREEIHDQISHIEHIQDIRNVLTAIVDTMFDYIEEDHDGYTSYYESDEWKKFHADRLRIREFGMVDGVHHTDLREKVKQLEILDKTDEAITLLLRLVDATETETDQDEGSGVTTWYYERLAIIYRKQRRYADEISILERYALQPKPGGTAPARLQTRLLKAKSLLG